jgi:hypothetical protein
LMTMIPSTSMNEDGTEVVGLELCSSWHWKFQLLVVVIIEQNQILEEAPTI